MIQDISQCFCDSNSVQEQQVSNIIDHMMEHSVTYNVFCQQHKPLNEPKSLSDKSITVCMDKHETQGSQNTSL